MWICTPHIWLRHWSKIPCVLPICASQICLRWFDFKVEPIFATVPATVSKFDAAWYKTSQKWLKNNHLATLIWIRETDCESLSLSCKDSLSSRQPVREKPWTIETTFPSTQFGTAKTIGWPSLMIGKPEIPDRLSFRIRKNGSSLFAIWKLEPEIRQSGFWTIW